MPAPPSDGEDGDADEAAADVIATRPATDAAPSLEGLPLTHSATVQPSTAEVARKVLTKALFDEAEVYHFPHGQA